MDIIRWIETGTVQIRNYDLVVVSVGRADVVRSRSWFLEIVEELLQVTKCLHPVVQVVVGAMIPSVLDTPQQVREFLARNSLLQKKSEDHSACHKMWYICSGKVLLMKGGPVIDFFSHDQHLNEK